MKRSARLVTACAAVLLGAASIPFAAAAIVVTYDFSGLMNDPFGTHPSGTPFSGTIVWDNSQADLTPSSPESGEYVYTSFTFTVGGDTVVDTGPSAVVVLDNLITPYPTDLLLAIAQSPVGSIGGVTIAGSTHLGLQDVTGNAWSSVALPGPGLTLADLTGSGATYLELHGAGGEFARGNLTTLVPEPGTLVLTLCGLLGLAARARRHRRPA